MIDDLIGLPYEWGVLDCFSLADRTRQRFGATPLPDLSFIYENWDEKTLPANEVMKLLEEYAEERSHGAVRHLDLLCLKTNALSKFCLGTAVRINQQFIVLHIGSDMRSRATPLRVLNDWIHSVWFY